VKGNPVSENADLLWYNLSELPYFRGFLRATEGRFLRKYEFEEPILDLGCGDGHFGARSFPGIRIFGIDPMYKTIKLAKDYHFYQGLVCSKGNLLPFRREKFNTVICNSVLEHIEDVDGVLNEVYQSMRDKGKFFITVPNHNFTEHLSVARFFDQIKCSALAKSYRKWFNKISRHYHVYTPWEWKDRLIRANFKIIESFEYFPPECLKILEWGHYFGLPALICRHVTGSWVLYPSKKNIWLKTIYKNLKKYYDTDPVSELGAYSLIIAQK